MDTATQAKRVMTVLRYNEVVIGNTLSAVLYSFNNKIPLIFTTLTPPFRFDYLDSEINLSFLGIENTSRELITHDETLKVGISKEILWERLLFLIGMAGHAPLSTFCQSIRHNGKNLICSNEYSKIAEIQFQKIYYFGDGHCTGLVTEKTVANPLYTCYDWIAFNRGGKHEIDFITTEDEFVNKIWFYPTDRVDGNSPIKDACLVSTLTKEQLLHFDYSQTMARFKMIAEMRGRGMRGLFNGYSPTGTPKYYKFRTSIIGRERRQELARSQPSFSAVEIPDVKEEDLLKDLPAACMGYHRLLENL